MPNTPAAPKYFANDGTAEAKGQSSLSSGTVTSYIQTGRAV